MNIKDILLNEDNFNYMFNLYSTVGDRSNYLEASKKFGLDKSTVNSWLTIRENDVDNIWKKLIAEYMIRVNPDKTLLFMNTYNLNANVSEKLISLAFDMTKKEVNSFLISSKKWKNNFIDFLRSLNDELLVFQINFVRKELFLPTIDYLEVLRLINDID